MTAYILCVRRAFYFCPASDAYVKFGSQPMSVDCVGGVAVVACLNTLDVVSVSGETLSSMAAPSGDQFTHVSIRPGGGQVAVSTVSEIKEKFLKP